ncbi:eCIS core domain-containing protein [Kribbella monticola]|uniref:eCIS core domain-containing protein n=1 Tax=Kribbella monticola TaxID=2185285 RepID=UPI000DD395E8|nr:DUF4157 domain-containing protein [Kribbella monticola]
MRWPFHLRRTPAAPASAEPEAAPYAVSAVAAAGSAPYAGSEVALEGGASAEVRRPREWARGETLAPTIDLPAPLTSRPSVVGTPDLLRHRVEGQAIPVPRARVDGLARAWAAPSMAEADDVGTIPVFEAVPARKPLVLGGDRSARVPLTTVTDDSVGPPQEPAQPFRSIGEFERMLADFEASDVAGVAMLTGFSSSAAPPPLPTPVAPSAVARPSSRRSLAESRKRGLRAETVVVPTEPADAGPADEPSAPADPLLDHATSRDHQQAAPTALSATAPSAGHQQAPPTGESLPTTASAVDHRDPAAGTATHPRVHSFGQLDATDRAAGHPAPPDDAAEAQWRLPLHGGGSVAGSESPGGGVVGRSKSVEGRSESVEGRLGEQSGLQRARSAGQAASGGQQADEQPILSSPLPALVQRSTPDADGERRTARGAERWTAGAGDSGAGRAEVSDEGLRSDGLGDGLRSDGSGEGRRSDGSGEGRRSDGSGEGLRSDGSGDGLRSDGSGEGRRSDGSDEGRRSDGSGDGHRSDDSGDRLRADGVDNRFRGDGAGGDLGSDRDVLGDGVRDSRLDSADDAEVERTVVAGGIEVRRLEVSAGGLAAGQGAESGEGLRGDGAQSRGLPSGKRALVLPRGRVGGVRADVRSEGTKPAGLGGGAEPAGLGGGPELAGLGGGAEPAGLGGGAEPAGWEEGAGVGEAAGGWSAALGDRVEETGDREGGGDGRRVGAGEVVAGEGDGSGRERDVVVPRGVLAAVGARFGVVVEQLPIRRGRVVGARAGALSARAFTADGVVQLPDEAGPLTDPGVQALVAHELTHVLQQRALGSQLPAMDSVAGLELEAAAVRTEEWFRTQAAESAPLLHRRPPSPPPTGERIQTAPVTATTVASFELPQAPAEADIDLAELAGISLPQMLPPATEPESPAPAAELTNPDPQLLDRLDRLESSIRELAEQQPGDPVVRLDDPGGLGRLAERLYGVLRQRLRNELIIDRERRGVLADLR